MIDWPFLSLGPDLDVKSWWLIALFGPNVELKFWWLIALSFSWPELGFEVLIKMFDWHLSLSLGPILDFKFWWLTLFLLVRIWIWFKFWWLSAFLTSSDPHHETLYMGTGLSGMEGGQSQFQLWTGGVLDFIYNFTFIPALAHRHATGSSGDLFFKSARQLLGRKVAQTWAHFVLTSRHLAAGGLAVIYG